MITPVKINAQPRFSSSGLLEVQVLQRREFVGDQVDKELQRMLAQEGDKTLRAKLQAEFIEKLQALNLPVTAFKTNDNRIRIVTGSPAQAESELDSRVQTLAKEFETQHPNLHFRWITPLAAMSAHQWDVFESLKRPAYITNSIQPTRTSNPSGQNSQSEPLTAQRERTGFWHTARELVDSPLYRIGLVVSTIITGLLLILASRGKGATPSNQNVTEVKTDAKA